MITLSHIFSKYELSIATNPMKIGTFNLEKSRDLLTQKDHLRHLPSFRLTRTYTRKVNLLFKGLLQCLHIE